MMLRSETAHGFVRVDWYSPQGLPTWGDGRLVILGAEGYSSCARTLTSPGGRGDHLFVVDGAGTEYVHCSDVAMHYYPDLVHDVINRTETACPQRHTFEVMRLAITAQQNAAKRGYEGERLARCRFG